MQCSISSLVLKGTGLAEAGQKPATTVTASNEVNHIVASTEMRSGRGWQDRVQHRSIKDFAAGDAEKVHMHATSCECGKPSQGRLDVSSYAALCPTFPATTPALGQHSLRSKTGGVRRGCPLRYDGART